MFQDYPSKALRVCLSYGIDKAILSQLTEEVSESRFEGIVVSSYEIVHAPEVVWELKPAILNRVLERINSLQTPSENKPKSLKKSFGTSYADWLGKLTATESCLYLADFDIEKALKLYWEEDFTLVQKAFETKAAHASQLSLIQLEASMYGFGGKYADDGENVMDMHDPKAREALAAFGF
jgi:hypothetical protein